MQHKLIPKDLIKTFALRYNFLFYINIYDNCKSGLFSDGRAKICKYLKPPVYIDCKLKTK